MAALMSRQEWAEAYARSQGTTVWARERLCGLVAVPCTCGWIKCEGWAMGYPEEVAE